MLHKVSEDSQHEFSKQIYFLENTSLLWDSVYVMYSILQLLVVPSNSIALH